jgi:hypothetical protein
LLLRSLQSRELIVALVVLGIGLRVAQYIANRSLWIDEADVALNLLSRSFGQLTEPLDFGQGAPLGFLFAEEAATRVFGYSEYSLRLFPLMCGTVSVLAFAVLARRVLSRSAAPFAVLLFAVADGLIYYSSELKPYSTDVAASVLLMLAANTLVRRAPSAASAAALALGGLVLLAFSFPAVLGVTAVAVTVTVAAILRRPAALRPATLVAVAVWLTSAIAVGVFAAIRLEGIRSAGSGDRFLGVTDSASLGHAINVFGTNLVSAMGLLADQPFNQVEKIALVCVLVGVLSFAQRDRLMLAVLLIPVGLAFLGSALHAYPISLRTELFLVPSIILLLVEGVVQAVRLMPDRWRSIGAIALAIVLAAGPVYQATARLVHPRQREEIRPVLEFVRDHWKAGDTLYIHSEAQYAFRYYSECKCLRLTRDGRNLWPVRVRRGADFLAQAIDSATPSLVVGRDPQRFTSEMRRLEGRGRVWFLYSHFSSPGEEELIEQRFIGALDKMGVRLDGIDRPRAHAYLYSLK